MMKTMFAAALAALAMAAVPSKQQGGDEPLTVSAIRFYSPASATTTIEGVCEVRLAALLRGVTQAARYRVDVAVLDSAGLELQHSDWERVVPGTLVQTAGATVVESFGFRAAPGQYRVRVRISPSTGTPVDRVVPVVAYAAAPAMSDLLLANSVRQPQSDSEPLGPGEIRRAGLVMRTAPSPTLTPTEASLSWYAELYPHGQDTTAGQFRVTVLTADGRSVVSSPLRPVSIGPAGGLTRGSLDLAGLPEGAYRFRLTIALADTTLTSEAPFSMASVASMAATATAQAAQAGPSDMFDDATEAQLDSLYRPLVYLAENPGDLGLYRTLTVEGKRRFLKEFWARRDPTPGTPDNVARDEFYRAVAYANATFGESGAAEMPGWNSDRGRIYLKNGRPDETLRRPAASPRPYEVWKFTRDRQRWYVFIDDTGLGHYTLIGTNDRRESSRQGWQRTLGADGTRETYQFLNLDLRDLQDLQINP